MAEPLEIVGDGDESKFGIYFFEASEEESFESLVVFNIPEYRFYLPPLFSFFDPFFAHQQFSYLFAVAVEVGRTLNDAVACRFVTGAAHRAALAVFGLDRAGVSG